ncbi:MAG TPA: MgtC/SapB family protein [Terriglobales bacterium]|nr:MgtC/SapB family protein [Terriglobales bacterium]
MDSLTPGAGAARIALALAIGMMVGFEREWSNKDAGIRTCALTALAGMLAVLAGMPLVIAGFAGTLLLIAFLNLRSLRANQSVEITTSAALLLLYILGVLVGQGEFFTPVAAAILATLLLSWKLELHRFAGDLHPSEIRSAIWLAMLAFVVYPLLPNRLVDRWQTINPHAVWVAIIVVAAVGFANYVLMRRYSARGMFYSAVLGGLVSSTATVLELGATLRTMSADMLPMSVSITLLATLAMFARNLILLAIFSPAGLRWAMPPLLAMAGLAAIMIWRRRGTVAPPGTDLKLASPISLQRVAEFGLAFLAIQVATTLSQRHWGHAGTYAIAVVGGIFNSAGATAAVGEMAARHTLAPLAAGVATVLASMASAVANAPVMNRVLRHSRLGWTNEVLAWALAGAGAVVLVLQQVHP